MRKIDNNLKNYLTVQELADVLGISRIAVFKKIQKGQIKAEKAGRNYVIYKEDLGGILDNSELTKGLEQEIEAGVSLVIKEYGEVLKKLGKE